MYLTFRFSHLGADNFNKNLLGIRITEQNKFADVLPIRRCHVCYFSSICYLISYNRQKSKVELQADSSTFPSSGAASE